MLIILLTACLRPTQEKEPPKSSYQLSCEASCDHQQRSCPDWDSALCLESCVTTVEFMRGDCLELAAAVWECYAEQSWSCEEPPQLQDDTVCSTSEMSLDACMTIRDSGD